MKQTFFNPKNTLQLFEFKNDFNFFKDLLIKNEFPKVALLSGVKGLGKSTLVSHLMHFFFDKSNYDVNTNTIIKKGNFSSLYLQNAFPNLIYLKGSNFKNIKIDDIRILKNNLLKSPVMDNKRFIILDDVELFNINSINALLKVIEEPGKNNHFILIENRSKPLLGTLKSRCVEFKFHLKDKQCKKIIDLLITKHNQAPVINKDLILIPAGTYLKFNYILHENNINLKENFSKNFNFLLNLSKKNKENIYKELLFFVIDYYLKQQILNNSFNQNEILNKRNHIFKNMNELFLLNLNSTILIQSIEKCILNEK